MPLGEGWVEKELMGKIRMSNGVCGFWFFGGGGVGNRKEVNVGRREMVVLIESIRKFFEMFRQRDGLKQHTLCCSVRRVIRLI